jgi:hypothetical protein
VQDGNIKVFNRQGEKMSGGKNMQQQSYVDTTSGGPYKTFILLILIITFSLPILSSQLVNASEGWLYFSKDKYSWNTKYYYDSESVQYFPDNHVSVWLKICGQSGEQFLLTELSCSSSLFRVVQAPPKDAWDWLYQKQPNQTQYAVSGWLQIPPDSEVNILKKLLCNNPKKTWN